MEKRNAVFSHRENLIIEEKMLLAEKEALLDKREAFLLAEKEKMVGQENLEIKRTILLPALQQKWEAEKKKIDAERVQLLQSTPKVWESLASRKEELEKIISTIKTKPSSSSNQMLLVENEGRLKQLIEIIAMIDSLKGDTNVK